MTIPRKSIITGALMLTAAGLITRLLGFVYRITMSNTIGAEGMGLYQLIMPIYSLSWSIACSGFTTTISKLTAQENARRAYGNMGRILKQSIIITSCIAAVLTILLFFGADLLGTYALRDDRTILPLRILSAAIPFMTAGSCIRGYFLGLRETTEPAVGQVLEQCTRMAVIYLIAPIFVPRGLTYACAAAVIGIAIGECLSFFFSLWSYLHFKRKHKLTSPPTKRANQTLSLILKMALPLTANRVIGSFLSAWENALIPQKLRAFGMTQAEAISRYGCITGMAMPLIFFPSALLTSLAVTLVPAIAEATAAHNPVRIRNTSSKAILLTAVIGIGVSTVFVVLPKELGLVIYNQDLSELLLPLGLMCPFWYINITLGGILNGLGKQSFLLRNSLFSSAVNIAFIIFFVPQYGVNAFLLGWFISLIGVTTVSLRKIQMETAFPLDIANWFGKPILAALAAGLITEYFANNVLFPFFGRMFATLAAIGLIAAIYIMLVLAMRCVTLSELRATLRVNRRTRAQKSA